jgi:hypothetical protein
MRFTKMVSLFSVLALCAGMVFVSQGTKVYAQSATNCGTTTTSISSSDLSSVLSTNVSALAPNSCFKDAFTQCSPATLGYDIKDTNNSYSASLAIRGVVTKGCSVTASVYGLSMTCTLNNTEPLVQTLEQSATNKFSNCSGDLLDLLPKNITIPASVIAAAGGSSTTSSSSSSTGGTTTATPTSQSSSTGAQTVSTTPAAQTTALPNTGAGDVIPIFLGSALIGTLGYRKFVLRSHI